MDETHTYAYGIINKYNTQSFKPPLKLDDIQIFCKKIEIHKKEEKKIHRKRHTKTTNTQLLFQNEKLWKKNVN